MYWLIEYWLIVDWLIESPNTPDVVMVSVSRLLSLNVVWFSVFELTMSMGQTDRQTDGQSVTLNGGGQDSNDVGVCVCPVCESADVLYRTTSADYGRRPPTVHTVPSTYWPRYNQFTEVRTLPSHRSFKVLQSVLRTIWSVPTLCLSVVKPFSHQLTICHVVWLAVFISSSSYPVLVFMVLRLSRTPG